MSPDPTLEALIAGGHFAIAADRYEEQTGDSELAALMRIDGLEWELVEGVPALQMEAQFCEITEHDFNWWLQCGTFDFGNVAFEPFVGIQRPSPLATTPIPLILRSVGLGSKYEEPFYALFVEAVARVCTWP